MEDENAIKSAIRKQIEFYFSDSNYRKDTFLRAAAESDPEGYVPIATLLTFNKLKSISTDVPLIVSALKGSEIVALSNDETKFKKITELPENDTSSLRTVYIKGFPTTDPAVTIDTIASQFSVYGNVCMVRMRRFPGSKDFKGSCFIEFDSEKGVETTLEAAHVDGAIKIGYNGIPFLCVMKFSEWLENKKAKNGKKKSEESKPKASDENVNSSSSEKVNIVSETGKRKADDKTGKLEYTSGLIFKISNVPTNMTSFSIRNALQEYADIKFVDYVEGSIDAIIRSRSPEAAEKITAALADGKLQFTGGDNTKTVIQGHLLEGEDEENYWKIIVGSASKHDQKGSKFGGKSRGRGRGRGFKKNKR